MARRGVTATDALLERQQHVVRRAEATGASFVFVSRR
jgi:hypothetical protein